MSSAAVDWALTRDGLTASKKLLLVALAWVSDDAGTTFNEARVWMLNKGDRA